MFHYFSNAFQYCCFLFLFSILFYIVIGWWLLPLIALLVWIDSRGSIIYKQERWGVNNKPIICYKFRTMQVNTSVDDFEQTTRNDPRVTSLGKILRKFSLDELPQFWNVITNTMSVVGPRPALPSEVNVYSSVYERRLIAKPGITGPWQISGRSDLDLRTSVALDLNYLINWSFTRYIWIILATVGTVVRGKGAY